MNICSETHIEICFEGMFCPLCSEIKTRDQIEKELRIEIEEQRVVIEKLEIKLDEK